MNRKTVLVGYGTLLIGTLLFAGLHTALARFQNSVGIVPAAGYFGPITRAYVNAHQ